MKSSVLTHIPWSPLLLVLVVVTFAGRVQATQTIIESANDGELDEHINWNISAKGAPDPCYLNACEFMYAGRLADDYDNPVVGPSKFSVMKFDVSSLVGQTITGATLRLIQTFDPDASVSNERTVDFTVRPDMQLAPTTEVYAVNSGEDFDETFSHWSNFTNSFPATDASRNAFLTSGAISPLGTLTNVVNPGGIDGPGAPVTFTDTDLTALVQGWIDSTAPNLGLLLLNEATLTGAPAAPSDIVARYATHESRENNPAHDWDPPQLIITFGSSALFGDYNGNNTIDAADYTTWRDAVTAGATELLNDITPGTVDESDFAYWRTHFGESLGVGAGSAAAAVPEPATACLALVALFALSIAHRRQA